MSSTGLCDQRVLVTGGAGFIGSRLAAACTGTNRVTVLDSFATGTRGAIPEDCAVIEADVRNRDAVEAAVAEADVVFHEAALVSVSQSIEDPLESHDVNAGATLSLLEAARRHDTRVVLASSAAIYGEPATVPIEESQGTTPSSPYGLEKLAADHYARLYHELYGLETVPLRYFNVYGPGQTGGDYAGVISVFVERALSDEPITVHGDGTQTRDFVFVDDVVRANLAAATTPHTGTPFNVGTGSSISIRELAEVVKTATDSASEIVHVEPRDGDIDHSSASIDRARRRLDVEPRVPIEEGIRRTVDWYRNEHI